MTLRLWGVLLLLLSGALSLSAQSDRRIGTWRAYLSTSGGIAITQRPGEIWAATTGGLLRLNRDTDELRAFTTIDGLTRIEATALGYLEATDQVVVGYLDGSIDYFADPADIRVLTDIRRSTTYTDKRINAFAADQQRMYVGTNFGLVIYDLATLRPIADVAQFGSNPINIPVVAVTRHQDRIYALLETNELYSLPIDFPNLRDPSAWVAETNRSNLSPLMSIRDVGSTDFGLFVITDSTMLRKQNGLWAEYEALAEGWLRLHTTPGSVAASRQGFVRLVTQDSVGYTSFIRGNTEGLTYVGGGLYYQIMRFQGLNRVANGAIRSYQQPGPGDNESVSIAAGNGELYIAPRGYDQAFVPQFLGSGVYYYNRNADGWANIAAEDMPAEVNTSFARAYYDPSTSRAYLGSWVDGLLTAEVGTPGEAFTCNNATLATSNGICAPDGPNDTRISGMEVDLNGNLWVSTYLAEGAAPLTVRDAQGTWHELPANQFPAGATITDLEVDSYGNVWMVNYNKNLLVYTSNGTPNVFDDGQLLTLRTGLNQGSLPTGLVLSVAEDLDGFIWVGTAQGVAVIFDPFSISQNFPVDASEPVVDGAPLLSNTEVNAIAIDGGNRKWFGTEDGVFLVSPDGDRVVEQFTADNSPLLSDRVLDIAIDQSTGEIFIATDQGVISYLGDATAGATVCDEVQVYPNPVFTDYDGPIVIRGMVSNSVVKITTVSGMLVRQVEALGGQATWDGRDIRGRKVRSGVYLALIADANGENDCVGKFVVIAR